MIMTLPERSGISDSGVYVGENMMCGSILAAQQKRADVDYIVDRSHSYSTTLSRPRLHRPLVRRGDTRQLVFDGPRATADP